MSEEQLDLLERDLRCRVLATMLRMTDGHLAVAEAALSAGFERAASRIGAELDDGVERDDAVAWLIDSARQTLPASHVVAHADRRPVGRQAQMADLRLLVLACCHPEQPRERQIALMLRLVGGCGLDLIAVALDRPVEAVRPLLDSARLALAAQHPYAAPVDEQPARWATALHRTVQIFEAGWLRGHRAAVGATLRFRALELAYLLRDLDESDREACGVLALLLLHDAQAGAMFDADGDPLDFEEQDRSRWDAERIALASALLSGAVPDREDDLGEYLLKALIAHEMMGPETNWRAVLKMWRMLHRRDPNVRFLLACASAAGRAVGPAVGLEIVAALEPELSGKSAFHEVRADLLRRLGRESDAAAAYDQAIACEPAAEDRRRLAKLKARLVH